MLLEKSGMLWHTNKNLEVSENFKAVMKEDVSTAQEDRKAVSVETQDRGTSGRWTIECGFDHGMQQMGQMGEIFCPPH